MYVIIVTSFGGRFSARLTPSAVRPEEKL